MKIKSGLALALVTSVSFYAVAIAQTGEGGNFELNQNAVEEFQLKETLQNGTSAEIYSAPEENNTETAPTDNPLIVREATENGYVERLLSPEGRVIAEKVIAGEEVIKNTLNYYTQNGQLAKQVTANAGNGSFYVEEFYPNGNVSSSATFINESNKIGEEHKYDYNGTLRQKIIWVLPKKESDKPLEDVRTIRYGTITTYYPSGAKAAEFSVGKRGANIFYDESGNIIKEINDSELLTFSRELTKEDCQEKAVELSLEELVELYEDEGDISYNKCGLPYREAFVYEIIDEKGTGATKISYDETGQIRRITPYQNGLKEGVLQKFDASGNLSAEINYLGGQKHGSATGYFPTHEQAFSKEYRDGKVVNNLTCYFPDGAVAAEFHYENGVKEGKAQINSPVYKELEFSNGVMLKRLEDKSARKLTSRLPALSMVDEKCLNAEAKRAEVLTDIAARITLAEDAFSIKTDDTCQDLDAFGEENGSRVCYDENNILRARYTAENGADGYLTVEHYAPNGTLLYSFPYFNRQLQGWVKKFGDNGNVTAEVYYSQGTPAEEARSFYENGMVKDMLSETKDIGRKVITGYNQNGVFEFSISYKDGKENQAFMTDNQKGKDIYVRFYEGELDNIREVNADKPFNFIDYNFALGEYIVSRDNELIRGGRLCAVGSAVASEDRPEDKLSDIGEKELKALDEAAQKSADEYNLKNAIIPTEAEKKQAELAAKNIGPVAKPDIEEFTDSVEKESLETAKTVDAELSKTEKFYYPNGNLRKTVKARGGRTEEIKEYSKSGLLLTQTTYNPESILIEKYFGSGAIRRKTSKAYDDNAVMAFISREDFYDSGLPRYEITRKPESLLFIEKVYNAKGNLKEETIQQSPLSLIIKEYDNNGNVLKQTETFGVNKAVKEFDTAGVVKSFTLNGSNMPKEMSKDSAKVLQNNAKVYNKGALKAELKSDKRQNTLVEYYPGQILKTEIVFFNNGEISVKGYAKDGTLTKFAYLAPDGKLQIQKPSVRTVPNYRERWWIDYNNPNWIENQDKYSVKSINRLYLDTAAHILAELEMTMPEMMQELYKIY